ncbi:MAG: GyrI-like domain-containing protein [Acidimicrobiia bacterium]|nr:GyrI-like domain-containing protein [Acidimicrobiia bacterium]
MTDDRRLPNPHRPVYAERVNAAVDYIERHLSEDLSLEQVAAVAHFSPFHFHRIFGLLVGETLSRFIHRLRMERAATWLVQQPDRTVTEIASACGIHSPSSFARSFREMFGVSATAWRDGGYRSYESGESVLDLLGNIGSPAAGYGIKRTLPSADRNRLVWEIGCGDLPETTVAIMDVPDLEVAYVRHIGPYQGAVAVFADIFGRLMSWAMPRGLVHEQSWVMAVYHDNPSITEEEKLRVSACVDVPAETGADGEIGRMLLPGGPCAIARFELGTQDYPQAWFAVAGGWLPDSGYEPDDRLPFERYPVAATGDDATTSAATEVVDICIPVRPLRTAPPRSGGGL